MKTHELESIDQLKTLKTHDRRQVIGLARVMIAVRSGAQPKLFMAYKNVTNAMNASGLTFEEMGRRRQSKSWKIVRDFMQSEDVGFFQLEHYLALMGMV